jgi:hypothetical protein
LNSNLRDFTMAPPTVVTILCGSFYRRLNAMTAMTFVRASVLGVQTLCVSGTLLGAGTIPAPTTAASAAPTAPHRGLALSLLDIMRASVQIPADGIWVAAGGDKLSEDEWLLAEQDSVNLVAAAALIAVPGTGKNDRQWVANADWQSWVREYKSAALDIHAAARAKDLKKLSAAGDRLTATCENCHAKYRPQTPSDGVTRYPFYPKRELPRQ